MCNLVFTKYRCRVCDHIIDHETVTEKCNSAKKSGRACLKQKIVPSTIHSDQKNCKDCVKKKKEGQRGVKRYLCRKCSYLVSMPVEETKCAHFLEKRPGICVTTTKHDTIYVHEEECLQCKEAKRKEKGKGKADN
ncbi:hypothetical protein IWW34DRAFT_786564 [Fusarium oxysporum f. sp. albedinis]|uniref:Uncharacterized protein n=1 Tax=Fusarium odoratissimum (strain NRRL 54006) TaxID=1089451 RepID=X0L755_FUSO5|nr:uncharacterized protein FOIG_04891 [Fusarium odoratissimum NRRL 54006]EXM04710.1 hypothetical protein FOIG_04891 [Fusarium odoratissimum NRRL 54006]KAI3580979.1 hypothetical protein IWW34DRAFT_786564 [Fusarium oxysporum f. sp. albedinis]KAK2126764.1 hypothetical protein NOF04DRAFT_18669 [Fusarium oxysporum II5]